MRILIIRHGDPNYELDCLTEKGNIEATSLANYLKNEKIDHVYVSPLGRAKQTCEHYLKVSNKTATECEWLREFGHSIFHEDINDMWCTWDFMPRFFSQNKEFYDINKWSDYKIYQEYGIDKEYNRVIGEFDKLIEKHGYQRDGMEYKAINSNHDTIALFCHFGLESVLLSRLLNISPFTLWHHTCALTTSVTTVVTEEREKDIVCFRMLEYGSINHLKNDGIEPSFSARFVECFEDEGRR